MGFSEDRFDFGFGDVAAEGFGEIFAEVAFGDGVVGAEGAGADAEGAQLVGEPHFGDLPAIPGFHPRAIGEFGVQGVQEGAGEYAVLGGGAEQDAVSCRLQVRGRELRVEGCRLQVRGPVAECAHWGQQAGNEGPW